MSISQLSDDVTNISWAYMVHRHNEKAGEEEEDGEKINRIKVEDVSGDEIDATATRASII